MASDYMSSRTQIESDAAAAAADGAHYRTLEACARGGLYERALDYLEDWGPVHAGVEWGVRHFPKFPQHVRLRTVAWLEAYEQVRRAGLCSRMHALCSWSTMSKEGGGGGGGGAGLLLTTQHHLRGGGGGFPSPLKDWVKFASGPSANQKFLWHLWRQFVYTKNFLQRLWQHHRRGGGGGAVFHFLYH